MTVQNIFGDTSKLANAGAGVEIKLRREARAI